MIHKNRKEIFTFYVSNNFLWDLIVIIPFIISQFDVPFTEFILLLRVTRIKSMVENLEEVLNLTVRSLPLFIFQEKVQVFFELFKLIYFIIFVGHFCACAWHYLAVIEFENLGLSNTWLVAQGIQEEEYLTKYIYSLYWSTITILTVGYGDLVPVTNQEKLFVIITALIICGVFGYSISSIGEIFKQLQEKKMAYRSKLKIIN
jgi:hypothetical protein